MFWNYTRKHDYQKRTKLHINYFSAFLKTVTKLHLKIWHLLCNKLAWVTHKDVITLKCTHYTRYIYLIDKWVMLQMKRKILLKHLSVLQRSICVKLLILQFYHILTQLFLMLQFMNSNFDERRNVQFSFPIYNKYILNKPSKWMNKMLCIWKIQIWIKCSHSLFRKETIKSSL